MSGEATWLLLALLFAHFLGDFTPLATSRMQEAKATGRPLKPIAGHAAVHGVLVALAVIAFGGTPWTLVAGAAGFEFVTHFVIDATRGRLGGRVPALGDPRRNVYWTLLGLDQLAHGVVLVVIAALLL